MRRASFFALLPWAWCIPTQVPFSSKAETEYRNYSNHQLWQLESTNELPQTFFPLLEVLGNISLWHATPSSVQIQVPPLWSPNIDALVASLQHFSGVELKSTLLVEDIGSLIPPVTPLSTYTQQFYQFSNLLTQEPANPHEMFHPYSAIHSLMYQMAADYSEFASISKIGETEEGKDVLALKVGYLSGDEKLGSQGGKRRRKGSDEEEEDVELMSFAVISGLHAREWIGPAASLYSAHSLLSSLSSGATPELQDLFSSIQLVFVPLINVDGYHFSWEVDRLWKKNRQPLSAPSCIGLDLNKGFGAHFAPSTTCSENTAGSEPFEAKELRAVRDLLLDSNYRWIGLLDLHSFGEHVSYPFSYSCDLTPRDSENLYEASLRAARKASKVYGRNFGARSACTHHAKGESIDWAYESGLRWSFYVDLRDSGTYGFLLPPSEIVPAGREALSIIVELSDFARQKEQNKKFGF